ncbi:MAG: type II toxin-antitoxin system death-on-curing family toxin [Candidatus Eiseniibacteriota bacterium]
MNPRWVPKSAVLAIHELLIAEHGGASGLLSHATLDSSLASPLNLLAYGRPDLFDLAAKYAAAITLDHPFKDGNKRVALTVAGVFLELNGQRLEAPEADAVSAVLALSTRELDEAGFASWLRLNTSKLGRAKAPSARKKTSSRARQKRK